jgi:hypothetical protein
VGEEEGKEVTAMTLADDEHDEPSRPIKGKLTIRHIDIWDVDDYQVNGISVIPESVKDAPRP